jgi:hypothetical protein
MFNAATDSYGREAAQEQLEGGEQQCAESVTTDV